MAIGIIGGTGLCEFAATETSTGLAELRHKTAYGAAELLRGEGEGHELYFLPRHGADYAIPPHRVNYRANIMALYELGCTHVIATNAVGSLRLEMPPGDLVIPHDYLDFTKTRALTFFDRRGEGVVHTDQTTPYCPELRDALIAAGADIPVTVHPQGVYVCTEGPRFETPAEIDMFAQWGGDVVGMTSVPEVALASELNICYASICIITNYAAGITGQPLTEAEVVEMMSQRIDTLRALIVDVLRRMPA